MKLADYVKNIKIDGFDCIDYLKNTKNKIFVYGAGIMAEKKYNFLVSNNINIDGFFVDDEYYKPNLKFNDINIYSKTYLLENYDKFDTVIGICDYTLYINTINSRLFSEKGKVIYIDDVDDFDKVFFFNQEEIFQQTYDWLNDEQSKKIMLAYLKSRITKEPKELIKFYTPNQYFDPCIKLNKNETFIDLGAYDGDTIAEFLKQVNNSFYKIYAFEADKNNAVKLKEKYKNNNNIITINKAVWSRDTILKFSSSSNKSSKIDNNGDIKIETAAIDTHINDVSDSIFLKADVEGAELEMLRGGGIFIRQYSPKLAICVYHKKEDLITIPQYIKKLNKNYKLYLRHHHKASGFETVLYACL